VSRENFPFCFAQRALAALRACSFRSSELLFLAAALPPFLPSCTAAGLFLAMFNFYTTSSALSKGNLFLLDSAQR
jgi:hypothetical protein